MLYRIVRETNGTKTYLKHSSSTSEMLFQSETEATDLMQKLNSQTNSDVRWSVQASIE